MEFIHNQSLKQFYTSQDHVVFWFDLTSLLLALLILVFWGFNLNALPNQIPLFYSLPWGQSQLVDLPQLIILPAMIVIILLLNIIISWYLHPSQYIIKRMLATSSVISSSLITITAFKILFTFI